MAFEWNPLGAVSLLAAVLAWSMSGLVLFTPRPQTASRRLALVLFFEGVWVAGNGLLYSTTDPRTAFAAQSWFETGLVVLPWLYLLLIATLDTPLVRWLRHPAASAALIAGAACSAGALLLWPRLFTIGLEPAWYATWEAVLDPGAIAAAQLAAGVVYFFTAVASLDNLRRARPGPARRRAKAFALAFVTRDSMLTAVSLGFPSLFAFPPSGTWTDALYILSLPATIFVYVPLVTYGILRNQLFDIDLKLKWGLRRGTLVAAFVAGFVVTSAVAEQYLQQTFGWLAGGVAIGVMLLALRPLERAADRLADHAMPGVQDTAEYRTVRKRDVYRAALEEALSDGALSPKDRGVLAALQDHLGLTAREAVELERQALAVRRVA